MLKINETNMIKTFVRKKNRPKQIAHQTHRDFLVTGTIFLSHTFSTLKLQSLEAVIMSFGYH